MSENKAGETELERAAEMYSRLVTPGTITSTVTINYSKRDGFMDGFLKALEVAEAYAEKQSSNQFITGEHYLGMREICAALRLFCGQGETGG